MCKTFNSLNPGRFESHFRKVIFKLISVIDGWGISYEFALKRMPLDLTDDQKSILVQVKAWSRHTTSLYRTQCWHRSRSMSPYHMVSLGHNELSRVYVSVYTFFRSHFVSGDILFSFTVPGELQTSLNDFTYTISTGFGDSDTYWNNADKCEKQQGWPVTYATLEEYEHIQNWVIHMCTLYNSFIHWDVLMHVYANAYRSNPWFRKRHIACSALRHYHDDVIKWKHFPRNQVGGNRRSAYATQTRCATWFSIAVRRCTYMANGIPHVTKLC